LVVLIAGVNVRLGSVLYVLTSFFSLSVFLGTLYFLAAVVCYYRKKKVGAGLLCRCGWLVGVLFYFIYFLFFLFCLVRKSLLISCFLLYSLYPNYSLDVCNVYFPTNLLIVSSHLMEWNGRKEGRERKSFSGLEGKRLAGEEKRDIGTFFNSGYFCIGGEVWRNLLDWGICPRAE